MFQIKSSEFEFSLSLTIMMEKTTKICRNGYDAEKRIVSKLSKLLIPNFNSLNWKLE